MSKRLLSIFAVLIIASMLLAACQPAATPTPTEEPMETEVMTEEPEMTEEPTAEPEMTEEPTAEPEMTEEPAAGGVPEECTNDPDEVACAVIEPGETIKIGYAGPMTGDFSAFGIDISRGGLIAVEDYPEFEGFAYELLIQDTTGTGEGGAAVANLYVADKNVVAIAGHTFSGSTAAAIPIYNEARLPMLSPSATRADLTTGDQDVFNRIPFTDDIQGTKVAEYMYNVLGIRNLAVMHDGDAYGKGLAEKVAAVFQELGGTLVTDPVAITAGEADYSGPLANIGALAPEAIFYGGYYPEAAVVANQMATAGMPSTVLFSDDGTFGATFIELAGDSAEGVYATQATVPESAERADFEAKFLEAYGVAAGELSTFTWHGYDIVRALMSVVESVAVLGEDGNLYVSREAMVQGVRNLSDYQGLTGTITCNETGECNTAGPTFFVVQDGGWVIAEGQ